MTTNKPSQLVPKLRFPEFRNLSAWEPMPLGALGTFTRGLTYSFNDIAKDGLTVLRSSNIQDGRLVFDSDLVHIGKGCPPNLLLRDGDVAICMSNGSKALVGKSAEYNGGYAGDVTVGAFCSIFRASLGFAKIVFKTPQYTDFIAREISGGNINNLKNSDLEGLKFPVPTDENEQQKIADCLGSLDDLIVAEGRKLEALRQHKQGLMQQLFPQPGETRPRLRFPEFQDTQEWRVAPLGKLFETTTGGTPDRARPDYWGGEVPWVTTSIVNFNVIESTKESISSAALSNSSAKVFPKQTVLMALYGQGKTRGKVAMLGIEAATNQACAAILPSDEVESRFVFLNLSGRYEEIRAISNSGGQKNLSQALVRDLPFAYPKERAEQHRIAECLTALDNQIAAQSRKLDTLKHHKQGLMQQLFPSLETK